MGKSCSDNDSGEAKFQHTQVTRMRKLQMPKISCPHFSLPEVGAFGCLPVAVLCLVIALFSAFYPYWVESTLVQSSNSTDGLPLARVDNIFIGLFAFANIPGGKTRNRGTACSRPILWACDSGYCLASCGPTSEQRTADIKALLSDPTNTSLTDDYFCTPCLQSQQANSPSRFLQHRRPTPSLIPSRTCSAAPCSAPP